MEQLRIIVGGYIGLFPTGGLTWHYLQYLTGLKDLGHDVLYLEDTGQYSTYQKENQDWDDATESIRYLKNIMEQHGFRERWAYRDIGSGACYGLSEDKIKEWMQTADIFINISGATSLRNDAYTRIPKKVLIDTDPMFTQVQYWQEADPEGSAREIREQYTWYDYRFTFGENIGKPDCLVPMLNLEWIPTRQPVCLRYWVHHVARGGSRIVFSTVMNWSVRSDMVYAGQFWGQKNKEFGKVVHIPSQYPSADFKMVLAVPSQFEASWNNLAQWHNDWNIEDPRVAIATAEAYQQYIYGSGAELTVAKNAYVQSNCGWFSDRSACYLAAGKPVITQETGWSKTIAAGEGLFAFTDAASALEAVEAVCADPGRHSRAARELAEVYFESSKVLVPLIDKISAR
ncbi:hypothetical protein [Niabella sp.]|uniref:glycosyltransferase n=1 Tax=Niabella sp. TaxID=1962976 RepID=UPI00261E0644|nr:hypothetical protein [Niabella sp.]